LQRFEDFVGVQGKAAWNTLRQVTTANFDLAYFVARIGRTDFVLDTLCGGFTSILRSPI
jgi:transposase